MPAYPIEPDQNPRRARALTLFIFLLIVGLLLVAFRKHGSREERQESGPTTSQPTAVVYPTLSDEPYDVEIDDHPDFGSILINRDGKTLYFFVDDTEDVSTCTGACSVTWPPMYVEKDDVAAPTGVVNDLKTIVREGKKQLTYKGSPLYYYSGDLQPGDTLGNEKDAKWFVVPVSEPYQ